jgi:hydroxyacylglutathione hydrolase
MILRQYLHSDPVIAASYLLGCGGQGVGAVVDPMDDVELYLDEAEAHGLRIRYVIDTHVHADHVSGGRALADAAGGEYVLWTGAEVGYAFRGVGDGDVLKVGNVELSAFHTPGHTPEHVSLVVVDRARGSTPWMVLTGHVEVLPGAFSGSVCGRGLSGKPFSTIGFERLHNRAFAEEDEESFVRMMLEDIPPRPPRAEEIRALNLGTVPSAS